MTCLHVHLKSESLQSTCLRLYTMMLKLVLRGKHNFTQHAEKDIVESWFHILVCIVDKTEELDNLCVHLKLIGGKS